MTILKIIVVFALLVMGKGDLKNVKDPATQCDAVHKLALRRRVSEYESIDAKYKFLSLLNGSHVFEKNFPEHVFIHVGKAGGASAVTFFRQNKWNIPHLHVFPFDEEMARYFKTVVISVRDPVDRFVSAFNYANPLSKSESSLQDDFFWNCFPNISVAADAIFEDSLCGSHLRQVSLQLGEHIGKGYCSYLGGRGIRRALSDRSLKIYVIRQERFRIDIELVMDKVGNRMPPYAEAPSLHIAQKDPSSVFLTKSGASKLRAWLELIGEYPLYRHILSLAVNK